MRTTVLAVWYPHAVRDGRIWYWRFTNFPLVNRFQDRFSSTLSSEQKKERKQEDIEAVGLVNKLKTKKQISSRTEGLQPQTVTQGQLISTQMRCCADKLIAQYDNQLQKMQTLAPNVKVFCFQCKKIKK